MIEPRAVNVRTAAEALAVSPATMRRMIAAGTVRTVRIGKRLLVPVAVLDELVA